VRKRRTGKEHTSGELTMVEMLYLRDEPLPEGHTLVDLQHWWSMLGLAGGWGGDRKPRIPDGNLGPERPSVFDMWQAVGQDIVADWVKDEPGTRPRCWWRFDSPEPLGPGETQAAYLRRHNLLLPGEAKQLAH
jgi:hypothetical protein